MFIYCNLTVLMLVLMFQSQVHAGKVIGGHEAVPYSRPYMALLEMVDHNGKERYCGGFLITEDFVMTAAHCQAKLYKVFLGLHRYEANHKSHSVKQAFPHENYNETKFTNDIMLLKLSQKVMFNHHVKPIVLADEQGSSLPNLCSVCGWGLASKENVGMSEVLMEASVILTENELCIKENAYCSEGQKGPYQGDSGGPLVCEDGKAYGVVSASRPTNSSLLYKYTKIPGYFDWIKTIIQHN